MDQILSQEEIDALLRGLSTGELDTEKREGEEVTGINPYDLTSQDRIIRGRMPTLEIINEKFARMFRLSLSAALGKMMDISVISIEMRKFSEFLKTVPVPSSINIFKMEPMRGFALFVLEAPLIFNFIDNFFGGGVKVNIRPVKAEGREFTAVEQIIIKKVVRMVLDDMEKSWKAVLDVKVDYVRSEINPQFVSIVAPTEVAIIINFQVETDNYTGMMIFCIPYSVIEPIRDKLYAGFQSDRYEVDAKWITRFTESLQNSDVRLTAELGQTEITVNDLVNLRPGDTIQLTRDISEELILKVENIPKFRGEVGRLKSNLAFRIKSVINTNTLQQS